MIRILMSGVVLAGIIAAPAQAELTNKAENGFTVRHQTEISAAPEEVWKALIAPSRYWNPDHSWDG